jgi:hypothetical protein
MKVIDVIYRFPDLKSFEPHIKELDEAGFKVTFFQSREEAFAAASGYIPADIVLYLSQHGNEILLYPAVYDVLKGSIKTLWRKVAERYAKSKSVEMPQDHRVEINFKLKKSGSLSFDLKGDISENSIETAIELLLKAAEDKKRMEEHADNPDLNEGTTEKPRIRMRYNKELDKWEPVDNEIKKFFDDAWDNLGDDYPM